MGHLWESSGHDLTDAGSGLTDRAFGLKGEEVGSPKCHVERSRNVGSLNVGKSPRAGFKFKRSWSCGFWVPSFGFQASGWGCVSMRYAVDSLQ